MHEHFKDYSQWKKVLKVASGLNAKAFQAFVVGGCVRDFLLKREPKDFDMVTDAPMTELIKLFPGAVTVGAQFGVLVLPYKDFQIELSSFRKDGAYQDGRRPVEVSAGNIKDDGARRDFSINALFYNLQTKEILDFHKGMEDLKQKRIITVGPAFQRFQEDHLRLLRAIRFSIELNFFIEENTGKAIVKQGVLLKKISKERLGEELKKIFSADFVKGLLLLEEKSLLPLLLKHLDLSLIKKQLIKLNTKEYLLKPSAEPANTFLKKRLDSVLRPYFLLLSVIIGTSPKNLALKSGLLFIEDLKILKFTKIEIQFLKQFTEMFVILNVFCLKDFLKQSQGHKLPKPKGVEILPLHGEGGLLGEGYLPGEGYLSIKNADITDDKLDPYYEFVNLVTAFKEPSKIRQKEVQKCMECIINNGKVFSKSLVANLKLYLQIMDLIDKKAVLFPKWEDLNLEHIAPRNRSSLLKWIYAQKILALI